MKNNFDPSNAVAVQETPQGTTPTDTGNFNVDNAVAVDDQHGRTQYERFSDTGKDLTDQELRARGESDYADDLKAQEAQEGAKEGEEAAKGVKPVENAVEGPLNANKGQPTSVEAKGVTGTWDNESFFNAALHGAGINTWKMIGKPLGIGYDTAKATPEESKKQDEYLERLDKEHPVASVISGMAPYIVSAPLFPEALLPNIWGRLAVQFGAVSMAESMGQERIDEAAKPLGQKVLTVAEETAKGAAYSPIFAAAQKLNFVTRPFASALARSGVIAGGSGVMSTFFGSNLAQAFKQSGIFGALNFFMEAPHLAGTVLGRGLAAHTNTLTEKSGSKIDPDASPEVIKQQSESAFNELSKKVPGVDKPQIISSTIKLPDENGDFSDKSPQINGASHEDALNKIGKQKIEAKAPKIEIREDIGPLHGFANAEKNVIVLNRSHANVAALAHEMGHILFARGNLGNDPEIVADLKMDPEIAAKGKNVEEAIAERINQILNGNDQAIKDNPALVKKIKEIMPDKEWEYLKEQLNKELEKPVKERKKPGPVKKPKTLGGQVKQYGYMDFNKAPEIANEDKKGLWLYHREGAQGPDELAQELVSKNLLPEGTTGDKLIYLLNHEGGKLLPEIDALKADYDKLYKEWQDKEKKEDSNAKINESEIARIEASLEEEGRSKTPEELLNWSEPEITPSGQIRPELQAPIPGSLFQEPGELFQEDKDFKAGFTVLRPDGETEFIDREKSKQDPYNLKNGWSEDVKGLNESKFTKPPQDLKIVNPETLKKISDEGGKMDARLIPFQAEVAENLARAYKELVQTFVPPDVSDPAKFTAQSMRQWLGLQARNMDRFNDVMRQAKKMFDKMKKSDIIDQYTRAEHGEAQDTPELQKIWDTLQSVLHNKAMEVQNETNKLQHLIDFYLPHIWEDPKKAQNILSRLWSRKPFAGSKAFTKHRSIDDFETGIKAGLVPVSWNPVDLTMLKLKEMDKFLTAHRVMQGGKETGFDVYVPVGGKAPEGWVKIDDSISTVIKNPMIPISEAFDSNVMGGLNKVADALDIPKERRPSIGGKRLGYAVKGAPAPEEGKFEPGKVVTKFGTPEEVLAHEIGHQIDWIYGMKEKMFGGSRPKSDFILDKMIGKADREGRTTDAQQMRDQKVINKELRDLGDATEGPEYWRRKSSEKMAIMMGSLIHAPEEFKRVAPTAYKIFTDVIKSDPKLAPLMDIKPSLKLPEVGKSEVYAGGMVIAGHIYSQPDRARIINNYLGPGLRGNYAYDLYRTAGNTLIQARLSLSAFHAQFITNDANISNFSLGLNKLASGDVKGFLKTSPQSLLYVKAPWDALQEGRKLNRAWHGADVDPLTNMLSDLYAKAGGRAKQDTFWAIEADKAIDKAVKEGKYMTGVLHTPFWLLQQTMKPLMQYYVPRMKEGVFSQIMKWEIERNPNMTNQELLDKANKAVDTVDDRMGQLVYDNIFINKALKDIGMASVQSLGWDIGDVRLFGGGAADLVKGLNDLRQGKGGDLSYRLAYVISMPIVMGFYGAVFQYLHTGLLPGQGHEDQGAGGILKDLYFPRVGGYDPNGNESRVSPASYVKDIYHFAQAPLITVLDKLNPLPSEIIDLFRNKDFYGVQIYNPDDKFIQQTIDKLNYAVQSNLPYSIQIAERRPRKGIESSVESFLGMNIAPYDVNMTSAEKLAHNTAMTHISPAAKTKEEAAHNKAKGQVYSAYLADRDPQVLQDAVGNKIITPKERKAMLKEGNMSNLERLTKNLSYDEVFHVLNKGNPTDDEKEELQKILKKKKVNKEKAGRWSEEDESLYARSLKF